MIQLYKQRNTVERCINRTKELAIGLRMKGQNGQLSAHDATSAELVRTRDAARAGRLSSERSRSVVESGEEHGSAVVLVVGAQQRLSAAQDENRLDLPVIVLGELEQRP